MNKLVKQVIRNGIRSFMVSLDDCKTYFIARNYPNTRLMFISTEKNCYEFDHPFLHLCFT